MKIVINTCFGGYGLSKEAYEYLGIEWDGYGFEFSEDRTNEKLIECIEFLGSEKSSGMCAELKVVEIPDGIEWDLCEYDGREHIAESHSTWY